MRRPVAVIVHDQVDDHDQVNALDEGPRGHVGRAKLSA
jgi:hypothetical protein